MLSRQSRLDQDVTVIEKEGVLKKVLKLRRSSSVRGQDGAVPLVSACRDFLRGIMRGPEQTRFLFRGSGGTTKMGKKKRNGSAL